MLVMFVKNFYNVNNLYDLFPNVAGDTIVIVIYIHKYSYITYVLNIWFYLFNVSFISIYNLIVL